MKVNELVNIGRTSQHDDIILYLIIGCLVVVCICKYLFAKNINSLFNRKDYLELIEDNRIVFFFILRSLVLFLFSMLFISFYNPSFPCLNFNYLTKVFITFLVLTFILSIRHFIEILFFKSFYDANSAIYIIKNASFTNSRNIIILFISCFLFYYSSVPKEYVVLLVLFTLIINRILEIYYNYNYRSNENNENKNLWYYKILYLCTLEILPILILAKSFIMW